MPGKKQCIQVFISHSGKDRHLAWAIIELLRASVKLDLASIRCTSVEGHQLPVGASIEGTLRKEVHEATAFVGLITPNSVLSTFVLFELGARWGAGLTLAPLLAAGADRSTLRGHLEAINALSCDSAESMIQFVRDIAEVLDLKPTSLAKYQIQVDKLVAHSLNDAARNRETIGKQKSLEERLKRLEEYMDRSPSQED